jgi:gas vesicle protein
LRTHRGYEKWSAAVASLRSPYDVQKLSTAGKPPEAIRSQPVASEPVKPAADNQAQNSGTPAAVAPQSGTSAEVVPKEANDNTSPSADTVAPQSSETAPNVVNMKEAREKMRTKVMEHIKDELVKAKDGVNGPWEPQQMVSLWNSVKKEGERELSQKQVDALDASANDVRGSKEITILQVAETLSKDSSLNLNTVKDRISSMIQKTRNELEEEPVAQAA